MSNDLEAPARAAFASGAGRKGDWMQTRSGRDFWPLDPHPEDVDIDDIAHALSNLCRYGGHCKAFYSVAQHSVFVSRVVPAEHALAGLLHDASEAYCVDMPRPIKRFLPDYERIEHGIWLAVAERFGLPAELHPCVKVADDAVLLAEKAQIMGESPHPWSVPGTPADIFILPWNPASARRAFMARFDELMEARHGD